MRGQRAARRAYSSEGGERSEVTDQSSENEEARMVRAGRALNEELMLLLVIDSEVRCDSGLTPSQRGLRPRGESTTARSDEFVHWRRWSEEHRAGCMETLNGRSKN